MSKSTKAHDKRQIKMHFVVAESANCILALVGKVLVSIGAKRKKGQPPRARLERELQEFLSEAFAACRTVSSRVFLQFCVSVAVQEYNVQFFFFLIQCANTLLGQILS